MNFTPKPTPLPPPVLDVGEGWAAVIGVKAVLTKRVEQITEAQFREAAKIHETIERRAKSLLNGSIVPGKVTIVDYPKVLEQSTGAMDEAQIVAMQSALPPNDQGPYFAVAMREYEAIQAFIPKLSYTTLAGTQTLTPDLSELTEFSEFYALLDDPLVNVFGAIAGGSLAREMANVFQAIFPSLSKVIDAAIDEAKTAHVAKSTSWVMPWKVEIGLAAWQGLPEEVPLPSAPPPPLPEEEADQGDGNKNALTPSERIESTG